MSVVLGLTGSIATGKSTVVSIFRSYGFPIVDGDVVAREIVEVGKPALKAIESHFGAEILLPDGQLNRKKLGQIIFTDKTERQTLNRLLDPFLRQAILAKIEASKKEAKLVIVDIPLLFEGGYEDAVDQVATVYLPEKIQLERLMQRDDLTETEAKARIQSQWSIEEKKAKSQIVFDNQGTKEQTKQQVMEWLKTNKYI